MFTGAANGTSTLLTTLRLLKMSKVNTTDLWKIKKLTPGRYVQSVRWPRKNSERIRNKMLGNIFGNRQEAKMTRAHDDSVEHIAEYIRSVAQGVVDYPDDVEITPVMGEQTLVLNLRCRQSDLGKVIGKQGKMAQALRTLLTAIATKNQVRAVLEILE
jgi:predicted RNA-binding protein YlqC (UPF0109 family)